MSAAAFVLVPAACSGGGPRADRAQPQPFRSHPESTPRSNPSAWPSERHPSPSSSSSSSSYPDIPSLSSDSTLPHSDATDPTRVRSSTPPPAPQYRRSKLVLTRRVYKWKPSVDQRKQQLRPASHVIPPLRPSSRQRSQRAPDCLSQPGPQRTTRARNRSGPSSISASVHDIASHTVQDDPGKRIAHVGPNSQSCASSPGSGVMPPFVPHGEPKLFCPEDYLHPAPSVHSFFFTRGTGPHQSRRRSGDPPARYLELRHGLVSPDSHYARSCANPKARNRLRRWYSLAMHWNAIQLDLRPPVPLSEDRRVSSAPSVGKPSQGPTHQPPPPSRSPWTASAPAPSVAVRRARRSAADAAAAADVVEQKRSAAIGEDEAEKGTDLQLSSSPSASPLLLLDGTNAARALARAPRVIVVGDVHGCVDELQALLRLADFQPGDQVVLLGDLVAKGPDSVSVVKMARDIGARTVRGNHDHEVIRWCEAAARGYRHAMISLEHSRIAKALAPEDHAWLLESPWFIASPETQHLFVHAGFIPGVKLTQQNPRLMMNMRSVLTDGTVTAKNVQECEWAKLWRGPETVVFGHDAHRGLQVHEYAKGIDTGCVYGGRLTALMLPENRLISVAAKRCYIRERGRFRGR